MKTTRWMWGSVVGAALLAGCAANDGLSGGSVYRQVEAAVLAADQQAAPNCQDRQVVNTEVVEEPRVSVTPFDRAYTQALPDSRTGSGVVIPSSRSAETRHSRYVERWVVRRCGERAKYLVTVVPGNSGAPEISVKPEP